MSQQQTFVGSSLPATANIEFIQGNDAVNVPPDPATHIVKLVGNTTQGISTSGNAGTFTETITASDATTTQKGVVLLADNPTTIMGTDTTKAITADDLKAKLGVQTLNGLAYGNSTSAAIQWLADATNGQIPIGSTGAAPVLGNITSSNGTVTVTNGAGTINLSVSGIPSSTNYVNVTTAMSPYTVTATDLFISCNSTAGPITILLPNAPATYRTFIIKDRLGLTGTPGNAITVTTVGGAVTIDGTTSYALSDNYESLELLFNGTSYEAF